ncbi:MAG: thioesterase [Finegoldia sp.]|nr:thioesterase [Finegoldia sp.]
MQDSYTFGTDVYEGYCYKESLRLNKVLDLMLEASGRHSYEVEKGIDYKGGWIILQWDIRIESLPQANKEIKVSTYSNFFNKFYAYRNFEIHQDGKLIVDARAKFMVLDLEKRRPMRVPEVLQEAYSVAGNEPRGPYVDYKIREEDLDYEIVEKLKVRKTDIDVNFHVNNARYVEWIENYLNDIDQIERIEILYKHEIMKDQIVDIYRYEDEEKIYFKLETDDKLNALINLSKKNIDS